MIEMLLPPFLIGFLACVLLTPLTIKFAKKYKLLDDPAKHKHPAIIHKKPIPRAGGLPIFISIVLGTFFFLPVNTVTISILVAGALVVIVGVFDDRFDLSPYLRFAMNIVCALIVVSQGIFPTFITNPLGGIFHFNTIPLLGFEIPIGGILAVIWIVWVMNMLNWSKGVDGQMPGIAAVSAIIIGLASLRFPVLADTNIYASKMAFIVAGASVGFLIYNFYPAKIFPGYSATILGFIIAVLSLLSSVKLATALLVMGIPTADALFTILRRVLAKRSPFWHDKGHLHHLLLDSGFSQRQIALFYWTMSILLGFIALHLSSRGKIFAIILLLVLASGFILSLRFFVKREERDETLS